VPKQIKNILKCGNKHKLNKSIKYPCEYFLYGWALENDLSLLRLALSTLGIVIGIRRTLLAKLPFEIEVWELAIARNAADSVEEWPLFRTVFYIWEFLFILVICFSILKKR
jgi:hypothetical protein